MQKATDLATRKASNLETRILQARKQMQIAKEAVRTAKEAARNARKTFKRSKKLAKLAKQELKKLTDRLQKLPRPLSKTSDSTSKKTPIARAKNRGRSTSRKKAAVVTPVHRSARKVKATKLAGSVRSKAARSAPTNDATQTDSMRSQVDDANVEGTIEAVETRADSEQS